MKLTDDVINVLKNFSSINPGVRFKEGNTLDTISMAENIVAYASVDESVPETFCIYDLNEFLSIVSLFKNPQLVFESDKFVKVTEDGSRSAVKYFFANPETIKTFDEEINFPDAEVTFTLEEKQLKSILKAASVLQSPEILVKGSDGNIEIIAIDSKDVTSNSYSLNVGEYDGEDCEFYFNTESLKLVDNDYTVEISSQFISRFISEDGNHTYFISVEEQSTYG